MLSVLQSSPADLDNDVYLDTNIQITFSQELHQSSLTTDNFRLYVMPNWAGQVPIKSITQAGSVVTLIPEYQLQPNTQHAIVIRGDDNTGDAVLKGVASVISEVMNGNRTISFTTGVKVKAEDEVIESVEVVAETNLTTEPENPYISEDTKLDIISIYPDYDSYGISSGLTNIVLKFDEPLRSIDTSDGISAWSSGVVQIEAEHLLYGIEPIIPNVSGLAVSQNIVSFLVEPYTLSPNTIYTLTFNKDKFTGRSGKTLEADHVLTFMTQINPMYTNVRTVRMKGGYLVPQQIPDSLILRYIFDASIWLTGELGISQFLTPPYSLQVINITTFKAICEIAMGITVGQLRYIKQKQLADLNIVYDTTAAVTAAKDFCQKAEMLLASISPSHGAQTGIKSRGSAHYPGTKRHIHRYNIYDLQIPNPPNLE